ncbi:hypothetical protein NHX12_030763 [Muraenolepis orangiensis]|uniref:Serine/threonine-protein phosphatase 4 regulatory subunit 2 n=1 Tax=Muraenolepis orangiensis TaxID=630683 RepID=A0A9Q0E8U8_9TELE|nr:hypothetical protein NHX12_030763 [Muraenolepis orangiensis]
MRLSRRGVPCGLLVEVEIGVKRGQWEEAAGSLRIVLDEDAKVVPEHRLFFGCGMGDSSLSSEALKDFDKKGKQETFPLLEQFLCHIAKTGETLVQWPQFKNYFLFKLESVMEDFRASVPEQRGPANPNVESVPFEDMKERILKIVQAYNGIPFTIQRLCELLTEPKRNYTGTEKFLRGIEKNVMVVSCVHPTSEKVNGPGTPRPLNRPKMALASSLTANGLPDSTEGKDSEPDQDDDHKDSRVLVRTLRGSYCWQPLKPCCLQSPEPSSSTQADMPADPGPEEQAEREVACGSQEEGSDMDQTEQPAPALEEGPDSSRDGDAGDPVSSSSNGGGTTSSSSSAAEESATEVREEGPAAPSSSTPEPPTEGATEAASLNTGTSDEPMDQD